MGRTFMERLMATKRQLAKEKTMAAILNAAMAEFAQNGYAGTKMRSIASRAGVADGLINAYFGSKSKLLCTIIGKFHLGMMYEGVTEKDPYRLFGIYIDHVRKLQAENPVRFRMILRIVSESDFPDSVYDAVRADYEGSPLETAALELQEKGALIEGDAFSIFRLFSGTVYMLLNLYETIGVAPPDDETLIRILVYPQKR